MIDPVSYLEGVVYKVTGSKCLVKGENGVFYNCFLRRNSKIKKETDTSPVVVGDIVSFLVEKFNSVIIDIKPRKNELFRRSVNLSRTRHVIASNLDYVVVFVTLKSPKTYLLFLDSILVGISSQGLKPVIVFNKIDLYDVKELKILNEWFTMYKEIGYPCFKLSLYCNEGVDLIWSFLKGNVFSVLGLSGVGKTSFLNYLDPFLALKVKHISLIHKQGQHVTTYTQLYDLKDETKVIDTPGIRGFGLKEISHKDVQLYFPEIKASSLNCKFDNCLHFKEPSCAVINSVLQGTISKQRYENYKKICFDLKNSDVYRRK